MSAALKLANTLHPTFVGLRMTADDFLQIPDDGEYYELIDGVVIVSPSPQPLHNHVAAEIYRQLASYLEVNPIGFPFIETDVHLGRGPSGGDIVYRAEVVFFETKRLPKSPEDKLAGPPNLMVEVVSESSRRYDTETKFRDYERFGVSEYWIIDPHRKKMSFYRQKRGRFAESKPTTKIYKSTAVPGFVLDISAVRAAFKPW